MIFESLGLSLVHGDLSDATQYVVAVKEKPFRALRASWIQHVQHRVHRQPKEAVLVHSDQGSQFTGHDWQTFLRDHSLVSSMSRRSNCHDNAVAESFFQLLKRERIRRQTYSTRQDARADVFNYIEMLLQLHEASDSQRPPQRH